MKALVYQKKAESKLVQTSVEFLNEKDNFIIVFQAPTGSGKTVMLASALSELVKQEDRPKPLSFIWISINTLHEQSKESLEQYFDNERLINCISVNDIDNKQIQENEILFVNWESLNRDKNLFIRDNERDWNLTSIVKNTKEEGRDIVLIIDESHRSAKTSKATELIEIIGPKLTIEVSATPKEITSDIRIRVPLDDVINEEMIKQDILINPGLNDAETNEDVVEAALKKRKELSAFYKEEGSDINPLLLVQIPNKRYGDVRNPEDKIIDVLASKDITLDNGKLAVWLSTNDGKVNLDDIKKNDSSVEVLIFKQAIAQGWDCPRASILLLQREWNTENYVFNIQTLGRIMRMPEHHYYLDHPELNSGFVYTATNNFSIVEDLAKDYVSRVLMIRDEQKYSNVDLPSQFIRRKREKTRLSGLFRDCLLVASQELDIKSHLNTSIATYKKQIGVEGEIDLIDKAQVVSFENEANILRDREEVSVEYSAYIGSQTQPYARARSTEIIKSSMRSMFKQSFEIDNEDVIASIVINPVNKALISDVIELAKQHYKELPEVEDIVHSVTNWQVPSNISVFDPFQELPEVTKSILLPYFVKVDKNGKARLSNPENKFIDGLEKTDDDVIWWDKNGERESKFFGIAYEREDGRKYAFYPDFLIRTKKDLIIAEIKDDNDFKNENLLKLNAGKQYQEKYSGKENLLFYILSPVDFENFFRHLKDLTLGSFKSKYEDNLKLVIASRKKIATETGAQSKEDQELLEEYDKELTKAVEDKQLLQMSLEQAKATINGMKLALSKSKKAATEISDKSIPTPFNICVLGEVADEDGLRRELRVYFSKYGLGATDWNIDLFSNTKLRNSDILRTLKKGQSKYNLVITGQIYHHSGKGNQNANLLTELKDDKYVDNIVGGSPKVLLTTKSLLSELEKYLS
jgi:type III restriction enzyme